MLNVLRENFKDTPYLKIVLVAVGVGLVAYLGNYFVGSKADARRTDWVARVDGADISEARFREMASRLDQYYQGVFGQNYDQIKGQLKLGHQAIEALVERELILQDARGMGLTVSAGALAEEVRNHPSLKGPDGQFIGTERYKQALEQNYPGGCAAFEQMLAEGLIEAKWTALVTDPLTVSDAELEQTFRERTQKAAIDYVVVAASEQAAAGEDELRRFYEAHSADYMRPAGRNIHYVLVDRDSRLAAIAVDEAEIERYYDANQATYAHPEQVRARHILFRLAPGASEEEKLAIRKRGEQALERLRGGADFAALAAELSEDPISARRGGDLDFFGRGQMVEAFERAAFDTPTGQRTLVESEQGWHVLEVTARRAAGTAPLTELHDDIRRLLQLRRVDARVKADAEKLRGEIGSAEQMAEVVKRQGLTLQAAFVGEGQPIPGLVPSPEFTRAVAALAPGVLSAPLPVGAGLVLVVVDEVLAAAPESFESARARVAAALAAERSHAAALAAAQAAWSKHGALAPLARALGRPSQSSTDLAPGDAPPEAGGSSPELERALFAEGVAPGAAGIVPVPAGALVYQVTRVERFDRQRFDTEKSELREQALTGRRAGFRQALVERLKQHHPVEYNPAWLEYL